MQLASMRYTTIDGTAVAVSVKSAAEAKAAVKELRHRKRELKFLKSALLQRQRAARPKPASRPRRVSLLWQRALVALGGMIGSLIELLTVSREERRARDPADIGRELVRIDETLHNIEGCILQLQGKLLTRG